MKFTREELKQFILEVNDEECSLDHHGYCQAHWSWFVSGDDRDVCIIKLLREEDD